MKLYEIAGELALIEDALEESGGVLTPELEAALDTMNLAFADKVDAIGRLIRNLESEESAYKEEIRQLTAKARARANQAEDLKRYVMREMRRAGVPKLKTRLFAPRIQRNSSPSASWVLDPALLPEPLRKVSPPELDYAAAVALWKEWQATPEHERGPFPTGLVIEVGEHLRLRQG